MHLSSDGGASSPLIAVGGRFVGWVAVIVVFVLFRVVRCPGSRLEDFTTDVALQIAFYLIWKGEGEKNGGKRSARSFYSRGRHFEEKRFLFVWFSEFAKRLNKVNGRLGGNEKFTAGSPPLVGSLSQWTLRGVSRLF